MLTRIYHSKLNWKEPLPLHHHLKTQPRNHEWNLTLQAKLVSPLFPSQLQILNYHYQNLLSSFNMLTYNDDLSSIDTRSDTRSLTLRPPTICLPLIFVISRPDHPWHEIAIEIFKTSDLNEVTAKPGTIQINCPDETTFHTVQSLLENN